MFSKCNGPDSSHFLTGGATGRHSACKKMGVATNLPQPKQKAQDVCIVCEDSPLGKIPRDKMPSIMKMSICMTYKPQLVLQNKCYIHTERKHIHANTHTVGGGSTVAQ